VKPGTYREQVTVPASGAAGNPLEIQALGASVVVEGADDFSSPAQWVLYSGAVHLASAVTWNPLQVFMDGVRLAPSAVAPASLPSGSFTWVSGQGLYVNAGGGNPGAHALLVGRRMFGFTLNARSWVTIGGFDVRHSEDRGFNIATGCANLVISQNRVTFSNSYGVRCNASTGILIDDNLVSRTATSTASASSPVRPGASSAGTSRSAMPTPSPRGPTASTWNASSGNTLAANRVHDNQDAGVLLKSSANNCVSYNNVSWNNGDHGFDHLASSGRSTRTMSRSATSTTASRSRAPRPTRSFTTASPSTTG
jgi:parallel beta-helix repeat protein